MLNSHIIVEDEYSVVQEHEGMTIIARRARRSPVFSVAALVLTGSWDDVIPGTAHFFEHLPFGSSRNFKDNDVFTYMQDRGGGVSASTDFDKTIYAGGVKKGNEADAVFAIADIATRWNFEPKRIDHECKVIANELAFRAMEAVPAFMKNLAATAYGSTGCMTPVIGTEATIAKIDLGVVNRFAAANYCADRLIVAMEGDCSHEKMFDLARENFRLPRGAPAIARPDVVAVPQTLVLPTSQEATRGSIVFQGPNMQQPLRTIAAHGIMCDMLFGITGNVMAALRGTDPLVYAVGFPKGAMSSEKHFAYNAVTFDTIVANVPRVVEKLCIEINHFAANPSARQFKNILDNEIMAETENLGGRLAISSIGNLARRLRILKTAPVSAAELALSAYNMNRIPSRRACLDILKSMTLDDIVVAAEKMFADAAPGVLYQGQHRPNFPNHLSIGERFQK